MRIRRLSAILICALMPSCGDEGSALSYSEASELLTIDQATTLQSALDERPYGRVRVLFEVSLAQYRPANERVRELNDQFRVNKRDNSFCFGQRGRVFNSNFVCGYAHFDIMFLARNPDQAISANLADIMESSDDPLRSELSAAIEALSKDPINTAKLDCVRLVFKNMRTSAVERNIPIVIMIADRGMSLPTESLRVCLE